MIKKLTAWHSLAILFLAVSFNVLATKPAADFDAIDESDASYPLTNDPSFQQQAYIKASNTHSSDLFGEWVAIYGDTLVVAAAYENSNTTGVNGNQTNNSANDAGAAYVYVRNGTEWSQQAYIKASNTGAEDRFGSSPAISGDTLAVGAELEDSSATGINGNQADNSAVDAGAVYVFTRNGTDWSQQAYVKASNAGGGDRFGQSVAISGDTLVVGAEFEDSNATGINGNQADNSANDAGAVYVFTRSGTVWSQQAYLKASNAEAGDQYGRSVAISGDTLVVGAFNEDSSTTGINGNQGNNSSPGAGAVYVYTRSGTTWSQQAYLKASNTDETDRFGRFVAISGDTLVVGATGEDSSATGINGDQNSNSASHSGAAYVFIREGTAWQQQAYIKASNTNGGDLPSDDGDYFGASVAIYGDILVVGAEGESSSAAGINGDQNDNTTSFAGAAYIFKRSGSVWGQQAYLKASNPGKADVFGVSVALFGDSIAVGAAQEKSNAKGINGNQASNSAPDSGAAYVFFDASPTEDFIINSGLNGNWWNGEARSGEGIQVEISAGDGSNLVLIASFYSYDPMGNQIFMIMVGPVSGDTAEVEVYITDSGLWGDDFDPALVKETQWGTGTIRAFSCEAMEMDLRPNEAYKTQGYTDQLMYDLVRLPGIVPVAPCPMGASND